MMKRKWFLLLIVVLFSFPCLVSATTINDYKNEISRLEKEKAESESKSADTQKQIDDAEVKINEITNQIVQAKKDQASLEKEIKELEAKIDVKEEEIKDLIVFYQVAENDNFYLKFIFGAENFEDLIYRFSVAEQLTEANNNLVKEMNDLVAENEKKVKELEAQQKKLDNLNKNMQAEIVKLGAQKKKYSENALSVDEEIATIKKQITYYKNKGCGDYDNLSVCSRPKSSSYGSASSAAANLKPSAKGFIIPLSHGVVTDYFGGRIHPITGLASHHDGMDLAASTGTTVMASNRGEVVYADWLWGFGYAVMVYHGSVGYDYTTLYGHLSRISVNVGDGVSRGQKIGEVGSTGNSTGPHLHFQAMYGSGYNFSGIFDPMNLVYIPYSW